MKNFPFPPYVNEVYLMLTEFCPLRCEYCYIKERNNPYKMPEEIADKAISLFKGKRPRIIFFGGEPLVCLDMMKRLYDKYKDVASFQVVTSGLVNFDKFVAFYNEHRDNFELQVSWDGADKTGRVMKDGSIRQDEVYNNIVKAASSGARFQVRSVINDININSFFDTYKQFVKWKNLYSVTGDFTIAHQEKFREEFPAALQAQLEKILADIEERLCRQKEIYIPQMILRPLCDILAQAPKKSCDAGNYIVVRPNGDIYPCTILSQQGEEFAMGNVNQPRNIDCGIVDALNYAPEKCQSCSFNAICDGGCRYERYGNFGGDWAESICAHTCKINSAIYKTVLQWFENLPGNKQSEMLDMGARYRTWISHHYAVSTDERVYSNAFSHKES